MGGFLGNIAEKVIGSGTGEELGQNLTKVLSSGFEAINKLAPKAGPRLTAIMQRAKEAEEQMTGPEAEWWTSHLKGVTGTDAEALQKHMEGTPAASPVVSAKAAGATKRLSDIQDVFETAGLADPKNRIANYWPHVIPKEMYQGKKYQNLLQQLVATGKAKNLNDAEMLLSYASKGGVKAGHFEIPRLTSIPQYRRDLSVLPEAATQGLRRLNSVKWFGKNDEVLNKLFRDIEMEVGNKQVPNFARSLAQHYLERPVLNAPEMTDLPSSNIMQAYTSWSAASKLSLAITSHANKPLNILFMHGIGPMARAMTSVASDYGDAREFAVKAGSLATRALVEFRNQEGPEQPLFQRLGSKVLQMSGLYKADRFYRVLASEAGRMAAQDYANGLLAKPTSQLYRARLAQLGIDPMDVIKAGGLSKDMEMQAAKRTSDMTQFRQDVSSLPLWWRNTTYGRLASMFKSFYFQQAKFLKDVVVKPAVQYHDFRPLAYLALVAPVAAEPFVDIRELLRGRYDHRPGGLLDRAVDNMLTGGVFGMFYEIPQSLSSPSENFMWRMLLSNMFVPLPLQQAASMTMTTAEALKSRHPTEKLEQAVEKRAVMDIPYIGPYLYHQQFPPKKPYKGPLERGVLTRGAERLFGGE